MLTNLEEEREREGGDSLDDTGGLGRLCAFADRPRADLVGPAGEVADEVEGGVAGGGDLAEGGDGADLLLLLGALLVRGEEGEALLEGDGEGDERVAGVVLVDPGFDLGQPLVLLADVVPLGEVDEVGDWLGGEELEAVDDVDLEGGGWLVCVLRSERVRGVSQMEGFLIGIMGRYSRLGELG